MIRLLVLLVIVLVICGTASALFHTYISNTRDD